MTKITDPEHPIKEFDKISDELYQLELAKADYQNNITSILEIDRFFSQKLEYAKTQKKECFSINNIDAEVTCGHLLSIVEGLSGSYKIINRFCQRLIFENRALKHELENQLRKSKTEQPA